jgi:hypothetical protein
MHLTVLAVPGCPNAPVLRDRLAAVLDGRAGVSVSQQVVSDEGEAARWGMRGSPTLLIDGVDPFAEPGQAPSTSCRLYRDENGQTSGAPSAGQFRQAIEQAPASSAGDPAWLDSLGRAGRGRVAPAERGLRAVHQAVLRSFVQTGTAPDMPSLGKGHRRVLLHQRGWARMLARIRRAGRSACYAKPSREPEGQGRRR